MYDYLSLEIENTPPDVFLNNNCLEFRKEVNKKNEPIPNRQGNYVQTAQISESLNLVHEYRPQTDKNIIKLKGSFHKHAQRNTNNNDYTLNDFERTAHDLNKLLCISPLSFRLRCFEYGVNIKPLHNTNDVLNALICYKGKEYEKRTYNGNGYLKRFVNTQYEIKIYNKSKQYNLPDNILRFEIKVLKMDYVNKKLKHPINTINDLLNPEIISGLINILIESVKNLYMYDYRINAKLIKSNRDKHTLIECINPAFWKLYKETHSPTGYKKKVKRFRELVEKYAPDNLQTDLKILVQNKLKELQTVAQYYHHTENATVAQNYPYIVGNKSKLNPRYCLTCGRDISKQRSNSKYCRYKINGKEIKDCKNYATNFFEHDLKFYPKHQLLLINIDNYLHPKKFKLKQAAFKSYKVQ